MGGDYPCSVCRKGVRDNSIRCPICVHWVHHKCSLIKGRIKEDPDYVCPRCRGLSRPIAGRPAPTVKVDEYDEEGNVVASFDVDVVAKFCYLGDMLEAVEVAPRPSPTDVELPGVNSGNSAL